jgi:hypothetical protein
MQWALSEMLNALIQNAPFACIVQHHHLWRLLCARCWGKRETIVSEVHSL